MTEHSPEVVPTDDQSVNVDVPYSNSDAPSQDVNADVSDATSSSDAPVERVDKVPAVQASSLDEQTRRLLTRALRKAEERGDTKRVEDLRRTIDNLNN